MKTAERETVYLRDRNSLTPKQRRRIRHKENEALRLTLDGDKVPRYGRLRRRIDRKEARRLRRESAGIAQRIRARLANPVVTSGRSRRSGDGRKRSERSA